MNHFHVTCPEAGMTIWVQLLAASTLKFWRAKKSEIRRDFGQLQILIADIPRTEKDIENRKSNYNPSHVREQELGELWSTNKKL